MHVFFIPLHEVREYDDGVSDTVYIRTDKICTVTGHDVCTRITLDGNHPTDWIEVREKPKEIFKLMKEAADEAD